MFSLVRLGLQVVRETVVSAVKEELAKRLLPDVTAANAQLQEVLQAVRSDLEKQRERVKEEADLRINLARQLEHQRREGELHLRELMKQKNEELVELRQKLREAAVAGQPHTNEGGT